jgi:2,4-dienoyl-CoA reductase (NADPH2)
MIPGAMADGRRPAFTDPCRPCDNRPVHLLAPLDLRGRTAPNRILFGPHETNLGHDRALSARHLAYYGRRMAGGVGTLVVEEASVHESDWPYERCPLAAACGPGWSELAALGRRHGTVVLAGIGHTGGQGSSAYSQLPLWAPSGVPEVNSREVPKVMETRDIDAVVAGFAAAARLAVTSGLDGVEVNAGQNSLIRQFLSGLTNLRGDGYGTDRVRFAREVLAAVRSAAPDAVVGLRLSCDELAPWAGIVPEAAADIAATLSELVDYLVVVRGSIFTVGATRPDGHVVPGFNLDLTGQIRAAVAGRVPVVAQGSIVDVGQAEWAIGEGRCDAVEMTRAQIADPDLATKAAGDPARIRPCILCNQLCKVRDARNPLVSCVGEPRSGHETVDPDPTAAAGGPARDVVVVGGGPAGLEAARMAATRGHRVVLREATSRAGGAVRAAAAGAGRDRLALLVDWLEAECRALGVEVATCSPVRADDLTALADQGRSVVLATGSRPGPLAAEVAEGAVVVPARDVLGGAELPDGPVAVWDPIGGPIGISVAESLVATGRHVALVTPDLIAGNELSRSGDLAPANVRLQAAGVALVKRAVLRAVRPGWVEVEQRFTGERHQVEAVALVDAGHRLADQELAAAADGAHLQAGDCVAPRTIHEAVLEGRRAALALEEVGP